MIDVFSRCPLCGANSPLLLFTHKEVGRFVRCNQCDLVYIRERPTPSYVELRRKEPVPLPDVIIHKEIDQIPDFQDLLNRLKQYQGYGKLLELGCLTGHFLNLARGAGYDVTGIEPDPWAAGYARRHFALNVCETLVTDLHFDAEMFDAIVMIGVMEHLTDPTHTLLELRRILSDSGILVVETPVIGTTSFKILGRHHRHVVFDHILLFSRATVRDILDKCGFYPVHSELVGRRIRLGRIAWNLRNMKYYETLGKFLEECLKLLRIYDWRTRVNLRDIERVYCRKKPDKTTDLR